MDNGCGSGPRRGRGAQPAKQQANPDLPPDDVEQVRAQTGKGVPGPRLARRGRGGGADAGAHAWVCRLSVAIQKAEQCAEPGMPRKGAVPHYTSYRITCTLPEHGECAEGCAEGFGGGGWGGATVPVCCCSARGTSVSHSWYGVLQARNHRRAGTHGTDTGATFVNGARAGTRLRRTQAARGDACGQTRMRTRMTHTCKLHPCARTAVLVLSRPTQRVL